MTYLSVSSSAKTKNVLRKSDARGTRTARGPVRNRAHAPIGTPFPADDVLEQCHGEKINCQSNDIESRDQPANIWIPAHERINTATIPSVE